ncbi:hypothetical protein HMPREF1986_02766 [Oribacterium sp. oral taxon 078 str. F0263]|nr:hypothetical protein HMPREF1986_02766 [Oribacterium sp. oral taxon 078 str. F0263]
MIPGLLRALRSRNPPLHSHSAGPLPRFLLMPGRASSSAALLSASSPQGGELGRYNHIVH